MLWRFENLHNQPDEAVNTSPALSIRALLNPLCNSRALACSYGDSVLSFLLKPKVQRHFELFILPKLHRLGRPLHSHICHLALVLSK